MCSKDEDDVGIRCFKQLKVRYVGLRLKDIVETVCLESKILYRLYSQNYASNLQHQHIPLC